MVRPMFGLSKRGWIADRNSFVTISFEQPLFICNEPLSSATQFSRDVLNSAAMQK